MYDSYFYSLNIKYDINLLKKEIESYAFNIFKRNPKYGGFYRKENKTIIIEDEFRYARVLDDDLIKLKYTNYLKCMIEDELDIELEKNIPIAVTEPNKISTIHKDGTNEYGYRFAINFPLFKIDYGYTEFWELENESEATFRHMENGEGGVLGVKRDSKSIKKIIGIKMDTPKIINTTKYHSIDNSNNNDYRVNLSFRMPIQYQLSYHEIVERAKEVTWE